jgi:hypothetical protein
MLGPRELQAAATAVAPRPARALKKARRLKRGWAGFSGLFFFIRFLRGL